MSPLSARSKVATGLPLLVWRDRVLSTDVSPPPDFARIFITPEPLTVRVFWRTKSAVMELPVLMVVIPAIAVPLGARPPLIISPEARDATSVPLLLKSPVTSADPPSALNRAPGSTVTLVAVVDPAFWMKAALVLPAPTTIDAALSTPPP